MPRKLRVLVEGGIYHVYNRFARGAQVFGEGRTVPIFKKYESWWAWHRLEAAKGNGFADIKPEVVRVSLERKPLHSVDLAHLEGLLVSDLLGGGVRGMGVRPLQGSIEVRFVDLGDRFGGRAPAEGVLVLDVGNENGELDWFWYQPQGRDDQIGCVNGAKLRLVGGDSGDGFVVVEPASAPRKATDALRRMVEAPQAEELYREAIDLVERCQAHQLLQTLPSNG